MCLESIAPSGSGCWTFCGSGAGGERAAVIFSLIGALRCANISGFWGMLGGRRDARGANGAAGQWPAERIGPESRPELGVTPSKMLLIVLKGLARRTRPAHAGLQLRIVAHVALGHHRKRL